MAGIYTNGDLVSVGQDWVDIAHAQKQSVERFKHHLAIRLLISGGKPFGIFRG